MVMESDSSDMAKRKCADHGIAHLEHELKKPLAAVTSALEGIVNRKNRELTAIQEEKLKMVEVRIRKMAEITDTMLVTLKNSRLEVERVSVDIVQEIGMVAEMFRILYPYARLEFQWKQEKRNPCSTRFILIIL